MDAKQQVIMNKIKISNEQERIKVELDFESVEVAREWFSNEDCINDVIGALNYGENEETKSESDPEIEEIKNNISKLLGEATIHLLNGFKEMLDNELNKRK